MKWILHLLLLVVSIMQRVDANAVIDRLFDSMKTRETLVCVGLDPDLSKMPSEITALQVSDEEKTRLFLQEIVDLTAPHCCCYKIQKAFFDSYVHGHILLMQTIAYLKEKYPTHPVFVDCKIGDVDNTMNIYMETLFDHFEADGVVINPYMGDDVLLPFIKDPNKVAIVLVQTSNPNAKIIQEMTLASGKQLWEECLDLVLHRWNKNQNLIPVLSSNTDPQTYTHVRAQIPETTPILLAGIGKQGGDPAALRLLLNQERVGVFVNSSRGILYPYAPSDPTWRDHVTAEVIALKTHLNEIRYAN